MTMKKKNVTPLSPNLDKNLHRQTKQQTKPSRQRCAKKPKTKKIADNTHSLGVTDRHSPHAHPKRDFFSLYFPFTDAAVVSVRKSITTTTMIVLQQVK